MPNTIDDNSDRRIDETEVARMYDIDPSTVRKWYKAGKIPPPIVRRKNYVRWLYSTILKAIREDETAAKIEQST